jgi:hypothetical protein
MIKDSINAETPRRMAASKLYEAQIDNCTTKIESTLNLLTTSIVPQIFTKLFGHDSPFVTITMLDKKVENLSRQIEKMSQATPPQSSLTDSPPSEKVWAVGPSNLMDIVQEPPQLCS